MCVFVICQPGHAHGAPVLAFLWPLGVAWVAPRRGRRAKMHDIGLGNAIVPDGRTHEPDVTNSLRALIGWGILTFGMAIAIITRQRRW